MLIVILLLVAFSLVSMGIYCGVAAASILVNRSAPSGCSCGEPLPPKVKGKRGRPRKPRPLYIEPTETKAEKLDRIDEMLGVKK